MRFRRPHPWLLALHHLGDSANVFFRRSATSTDEIQPAMVHKLFELLRQRRGRLQVLGDAHDAGGAARKVCGPWLVEFHRWMLRNDGKTHSRYRPDGGGQEAKGAAGGSASRGVLGN